VATDTRLVIFGVGAFDVALNGHYLTQNQWGQFAPELQPNTSYTLSMRGVRPGGEEVYETVEFTTGGGPSNADPPNAPTITGHRLQLQDWGGGGEVGDEVVSDCRLLSTATGCPDTSGPDTFFGIAQFEANAAAGWFIRANDGHSEFDQLWPASCGAPVWSGYWESGCFDIRAMNEHGQLSEPTGYCISPPPEAGVPESSPPTDMSRDAQHPASEASPLRPMNGAGCCAVVRPMPSPAHWAVLLLCASMLGRRRGS